MRMQIVPRYAFASQGNLGRTEHVVQCVIMRLIQVIQYGCKPCYMWTFNMSACRCSWILLTPHLSGWLFVHLGILDTTLRWGHRLLVIITGPVLLQCQLSSHQSPESSTWSSSQFAISAVFRDLPVFQNDNPLGPGESSQSMGNEYHADALVLDDMIQSRVDSMFRGRIKCTNFDSRQ
jgi:hypothetical protein